jgi:hypothetical protein
VVGIKTCPDNPYDGHTLDGQLDQVERLTGQLPAMAFVDRGYRGNGVPEERSRMLIALHLTRLITRPFPQDTGTLLPRHRRPPVRSQQTQGFQSLADVPFSPAIPRTIKIKENGSRAEKPRGFRGDSNFLGVCMRPRANA